MTRLIPPGLILAKQKASKKSRFSKKRIHAAAVQLGKQGGLIGGPARAEALPDKTKSAIALHAANTRWGITCHPNCRYCNA